FGYSRCPLLPHQQRSIFGKTSKMNLQLQSDRLRLRPIKMSDTKTIHSLLSIPEVDLYNTLGIPASMEETRKLVKGYIENLNVASAKQYTMVIETLWDNSFIGLIALSLGKEK